ncbi:MAG TPA: cadherin-like domain-containing protein, partial [Saprospiraceae bacterium]|nr:cadherin-like domain-containing protein [Saprospiraceae bacterium]
NNVLSLETGLNAVITPDLLLTEDANNTHDQLVYTLVTLPHFGHLEKNWGGIMQAGDQFTQAELDNGAIRYFDYGGGLDADYFRFTVVDGEGGYLGTPKFDIQSFSVGTSAPDSRPLDFALFPNPAQNQCWIVPGRALDSDTRIRLFDARGQLVLVTSLPAGQDRLAVETTALPVGMYQVRLENSTGIGVKKLLIVRP